jgi:branched-chain amino acid transport system permease protein
MQVTSGIANGAIYASLALALVIIFQSTHNINFAQGEMATFSAYLGWFALDRGLPYWLAIPGILAISFVIGVAVQRIFVRPVENRSRLTAVIVFIGLMLIFNGLSGWIFGHTLKEFPSPFSPSIFPASAYFSSHQLGTVFVVVLIMMALYAFMRFTKTGLAMRGGAVNPASARLVGVNVSWMLALGWGLAAAIGAVAGILIAPSVYLEPNMMFGVLIYAFAGALIGGISNPWGAVAGGVIVGVLENVLGAYVIGTDLKLTVALVLIVAVLTIKPEGLFGKAVVARV